ncbi:hypothetical protein BGW38_009579, partial [Lunasporangiospora selenospora]
MPDAMLLALFLNPACIVDKLIVDDSALMKRALLLATSTVVKFYEEEAGKDKELQKELAVMEKPKRDSMLGINTVGYQNDADYSVASYRHFYQKFPDTCSLYRESPQEFWKDHQGFKALNHLAKIAPKYLCIQATSTESERLFSKTGQVLSSRRTQLLDNTFSNL